jgi:hypothetical protein
MTRRRAIGGIGVGAAAAVAGTALGRGSTYAQETSGGVCFTELTATVRQGPSAGLALSGVLMMKADETGAIDGATLWTEAEDPIEIVGQANGRLIGLVLDAGEDQTIYGVGSMQTTLDVCGGGMGGTFAGPVEGDSGDWVAATPGEECQACLERAAEMYNDYVNARRIIKACQAAGFCRFGGTLS